MDYVYIGGERRTLNAATRCCDDNSNGAQFLMILLLVYGTNSEGLLRAMMLSGVWCR